MPLASVHFAPKLGAAWAWTISYQPNVGLKPTTFSEPSGLRCVSFLASAVSSDVVFGGDVMPACRKSFLL